MFADWCQLISGEIFLMNKLIQMRRPISMMNPSNGIRRFTTISNPSDKLVLVSESDGVRNIVLNSPKSRYDSDNFH